MLPVDRTVADRWASIMAQGVRADEHCPPSIVLIAATALAQDLTVVTRNTRDFEIAGVFTFNPWALGRVGDTP